MVILLLFVEHDPVETRTLSDATVISLLKMHDAAKHISVTPWETKHKHADPVQITLCMSGL